MKNYSLKHTYIKNKTDNQNGAADVEFAIRNNVREMRAVTRDYVHIIKSGNPDKMMKDYYDVIPTRNAISQSLHKEYADLVSTGKMTAQQADTEYFHALWQRTAQQTGLSYERLVR